MHNDTPGSQETSTVFLLDSAGSEQYLTLGPRRRGDGESRSPPPPRPPILQNSEPERNEAGPAAAPVTKAAPWGPRTSNNTLLGGGGGRPAGRRSALQEHPRPQAGGPSAGSRALQGRARREAREARPRRSLARLGPARTQRVHWPARPTR